MNRYRNELGRFARRPEDPSEKDPEEAFEYLNELAEKAHTWTGPSATDSTSRSRPAGVYQLREEDNLKAQIKSLTRHIEALKTKEGRGIHMVARAESQEPCFVCGGLEHLAKDCLVNYAPKYHAQSLRSSLENTLQSFMEAQTRMNQKFESLFTQMVEESKKMKSQITKLMLEKSDPISELRRNGSFKIFMPIQKRRS
ncbi:hypothetical protein TIFTF001_033637 [Ficus carica]|uniref:CCHC-type domain-containing protein n=1 Tax=Ficus carica TaxID=3494 RepID=A0AA88DZ58_FICCA|nr:hypothetical protein TIFTF001_033637 [Ficus carica]